MVSKKYERRVASAISLAAMLLLIFGRGGKWGFADSLSKAALFLALFLVLRRRSFWLLLRHPACVGGIGLLLWYSLAGVLSPSPVTAWAAVAGVWALFGFAAVGLLTWGEFQRRILEWMFAGVVCLQTGLLIFQKSPLLLFPGNPQYASFWACAVVFLALSRALSREDNGGPFYWRRWIWASVAMTATVGVVLLPVRSGLLALLVGLLVFGYARFGRWGLAGAGLALILVFSVLPQSQINQRLKLDDPRGFKRTDLWRTSLSGIVERPLLGWGPGQFENLYWRHGYPQQTEPVRFEMTTERSHNDFLQVFTEGGIPGGLFALMAFAGLLVSSPKGSRGPGLLAAGVGLAAFSLVNFPMILPACGALVGCLAAFAFPTRMARAPLISLKHRRWCAPLLGAGVALLGVGEVALALNEGVGAHRLVFLDSTNPRRVEALRERADRLLHSGIKGDDRTAEKELRALLRWNPQRAELWRDLGHLEFDHRPPARINEAVAGYRQALWLNPHKAPWWVEMAHILVRGGDSVAARRALAQAIRAEPHYFDAWMGYGILLRQEGRSFDAIKWLETLRRQSETWPTASPEDSGYRRTVLRRDLSALDQILKTWTR
ncbi:MAG: O-antigen ligase family protein [Elusimicrobia bacterium]|nr:O-antigen ligase family protein [Elusimicrobiota bacterium]